MKGLKSLAVAAACSGLLLSSAQAADTADATVVDHAVSAGEPVVTVDAANAGTDVAISETQGTVTGPDGQVVPATSPVVGSAHARQ